MFMKEDVPGRFSNNEISNVCLCLTVAFFLNIKYWMLVTSLSVDAFLVNYLLA